MSPDSFEPIPHFPYGLLTFSYLLLTPYRFSKMLFVFFMVTAGVDFGSSLRGAIVKEEVVVMAFSFLNYHFPPELESFSIAFLCYYCCRSCCSFFF